MPVFAHSANSLEKCGDMLYNRIMKKYKMSAKGRLISQGQWVMIDLFGFCMISTVQNAYKMK